MEDNFDYNFGDSQHERRKMKAAVSAATLTPLDEVLFTIGDIKYLTSESLAILTQRGQEWYDKWPQGEPYIIIEGKCSKIDVYFNQVAELLNLNMHLAKNILTVAAKVLGIDAEDAVTVKQFCHLFNLKEEKIRSVIENIPPEFSPIEEIFNTPQSRAQAEKSKKKALESIATLQPSEEVDFEFNGLKYLTAETIEILKQRAMEWFDENPIGEAMACRNDSYRFDIHSDELVQVLRIALRTAQLLLFVCRRVLGKPDGYYVSVKEFCKLQFLDEDDFRRALRDVPKSFAD